MDGWDDVEGADGLGGPGALLWACIRCPVGTRVEVNVAKMEIGLPFPGGWWMWRVGIPALPAMSAETFSERLPQNVPGKFYVTEQCLDCAHCREIAPATRRLAVHARPKGNLGRCRFPSQAGARL
jgi:hypothetical protein